MLEDAFLLATVSLCILYFLNAVFLGYGLRLWLKPGRQINAWTPKVSVILPARNEEQLLAQSLESLVNLDYPSELLEIIVVDDRSTDATFEIASSFAAQSREIRTLKVQEIRAGLNGKANAIEEGVQHAKGEVIFITDADCHVPASWIRAHLKFYKNEVGMVGGITLLTERHKRASLFARLQSLDWLYLCGVGGGAAALGAPLSVFGNNFSFRKQAFREVGGFIGAGFSVIEDFALMRAIQRRTKWEIALPAVPEIVVQSRPASSFKQFFHQRKRWVLGGRQVSAVGFVLLSIGALGKIFPFGAMLSGETLIGALCLGVTAFADWMLAGMTARQIRRRDQLKPILLFFPFTLIYSTMFLPIFIFSRSVKWKGRKYDV